MKKTEIDTVINAAVDNVDAAVRKLDSARATVRAAQQNLKEAETAKADSLGNFDEDAVKSANARLEVAHARIKASNERVAASQANLAVVHRESAIQINEVLNVLIGVSKKSAIELLQSIYAPRFVRDSLLDFKKVALYRGVEEITRLGLVSSLEGVEAESRNVLPSVAELLKKQAESLL